MSENEKKTVKIKLERHLWPDEMRQRQRRRQVSALMIASLAVVFIVGFLLGGTLHPVSSSGVGSPANTGKFAQESWTPFTVLVKNEWYFGKDDENLEQDLIDSAPHGMSSSALDPHTTYMSAEQTLAFSTAIDNNFVGIGIQLTLPVPKL
ncbi:MAG: hypothetical protein ACLSA6_13785 [Holdemania massiliensis]